MLTTCSGVVFFPRAILSSFSASFSHLNWYRKGRALHEHSYFVLDATSVFFGIKMYTARPTLQYARYKPKEEYDLYYSFLVSQPFTSYGPQCNKDN
jgi:hypothetical protein